MGDSDSDDEGRTYCKVCDIRFYKDTAYHVHMRGVAHYQEVERQRSRPAGTKEGEWNYCKICKMSFTSELAFSLHGKSEGHKQKNQKANELAAELQRRDFFCEACQVQCTGSKSFSDHMMGSKHLKKVAKDKTQAIMDEGQKKASASSVKRADGLPPAIVLIQPILDKCEDALLGIDYMTEHRRLHSKCDPPFYRCGLCDLRVDTNQVIVHLTGLKHRLKYFKYHNMPEYSGVWQIKQKSAKQKKIQEVANQMAKAESRYAMKLKVELNPYVPLSDPCKDEMLSVADLDGNWEEVEMPGSRPEEELPGLVEFKAFAAIAKQLEKEDKEERMKEELKKAEDSMPKMHPNQGPRPGTSPVGGPAPNTGPRPGGPHTLGPRPGGPRNMGPRAGGPNVMGPRAAATGVRSGAPQNVAPRQGGPQTRGPRPGTPQNMAPRPGGPQTGGPRPGTPQNVGPKPSGPQTGGPRPRTPQSIGPRSGTPQTGGPRQGTLPDNRIKQEPPNSSSSGTTQTRGPKSGPTPDVRIKPESVSESGKPGTQGQRQVSPHRRPGRHSSTEPRERPLGTQPPGGDTDLRRRSQGPRAGGAPNTDPKFSAPLNQGIGQNFPPRGMQSQRPELKRSAPASPNNQGPVSAAGPVAASLDSNRQGPPNQRNRPQNIYDMEVEEPGKDWNDRNPPNIPKTPHELTTGNGGQQKRRFKYSKDKGFYEGGSDDENSKSASLPEPVKLDSHKRRLGDGKLDEPPAVGSSGAVPEKRLRTSMLRLAYGEDIPDDRAKSPGLGSRGRGQDLPGQRGRGFPGPRGRPPGPDKNQPFGRGFPMGDRERTRWGDPSEDMDYDDIGIKRDQPQRGPDGPPMSRMEEDFHGMREPGASQGRSRGRRGFDVPGLEHGRDREGLEYNQEREDKPIFGNKKDDFGFGLGSRGPGFDPKRPAFGHEKDESGFRRGMGEFGRGGEDGEDDSGFGSGRGESRFGFGREAGMVRGRGESRFGLGRGESGLGRGRGESGYGLGRGETGFGRGRGESGFGLGRGESGLGRGRGESGFGLGRGESGLGRGRGESGFGLGRGETGLGRGRGESGFGLGRGDSQFGLRRGGVGIGIGRGEGFGPDGEEEVDFDDARETELGHGALRFGGGRGQAKFGHGRGMGMGIDYGRGGEGPRFGQDSGAHEDESGPNRGIKFPPDEGMAGPGRGKPRTIDYHHQAVSSVMNQGSLRPGFNGGRQGDIRPDSQEKETVVKAEQDSTKPGQKAGSNPLDIFKSLSQCMLESDQDADMALEVSNALTEALMQYRLNQGSGDKGKLRMIEDTLSELKNLNKEAPTESTSPAMGGGGMGGPRPRFPGPGGPRGMAPPAGGPRGMGPPTGGPRGMAPPMGGPRGMASPMGGPRGMTPPIGGPRGSFPGHPRGMAPPMGGERFPPPSLLDLDFSMKPPPSSDVPGKPKVTRLVGVKASKWDKPPENTDDSQEEPMSSTWEPSAESESKNMGDQNWTMPSSQGGSRWGRPPPGFQPNLNAGTDQVGRDKPKWGQPPPGAHSDKKQMDSQYNWQSQYDDAGWAEQEDVDNDYSEATSEAVWGQGDQEQTDWNSYQEGGKSAASNSGQAPRWGQPPSTDWGQNKSGNSSMSSQTSEGGRGKNQGGPQPWGPPGQGPPGRGHPGPQFGAPSRPGGPRFGPPPGQGPPGYGPPPGQRHPSLSASQSDDTQSKGTAADPTGQDHPTASQPSSSGTWGSTAGQQWGPPPGFGPPPNSGPTSSSVPPLMSGPPPTSGPPSKSGHPPSSSPHLMSGPPPTSIPPSMSGPPPMSAPPHMPGLPPTSGSAMSGSNPVSKPPPGMDHQASGTTGAWNQGAAPPVWSQPPPPTGVQPPVEQYSTAHSGPAWSQTTQQPGTNSAAGSQAWSQPPPTMVPPPSGGPPAQQGQWPTPPASGNQQWGQWSSGYPTQSSWSQWPAQSQTGTTDTTAANWNQYQNPDPNAAYAQAWAQWSAQQDPATAWSQYYAQLQVSDPTAYATWYQQYYGSYDWSQYSSTTTTAQTTQAPLTTVESYHTATATATASSGASTKPHEVVSTPVPPSQSGPLPAPVMEGPPLPEGPPPPSPTMPSPPSEVKTQSYKQKSNIKIHINKDSLTS